MSHLKHATLLTALTFITALLGAAQERKPEVVVEYNRFDDRTLVRLRPMEIARSPQYLLTFAASFGNLGRTPQVNDDASLHFISFASSWQYETDRSLILLIDGERLPLRTAFYENEVRSNRAVESMSVQLSYKTLTQIANGKEVVGRLGRTEFELSKPVLEGLRELARRMKSP
jgi:hypothetical protein